MKMESGQNLPNALVGNVYLKLVCINILICVFNNGFLLGHSHAYVSLSLALIPSLPCAALLTW